MLKIYVQDRGIFGCIIVTASSFKEAHKRMAEGGFMSYRECDGIVEYELEGFSLENIGDR